jgi:hypothetical protein
MTREDIEKEGWRFKGRSVDIWFEKEAHYNMSSWTAYKAILHYGLHDQRLRIYLEDCGNEHVVFEGNCPDIETFRLVTKLVLHEHLT